MRKLLLALGIATLAASPALAHMCPSLMEKIDAAMTTTTVDDATKARVMALYDEGKAAHESGDHDASVARLNEALALLGQ
jgi:hypothetical protein